MNIPADSAAVRRGNLALVLRHIADHGPCARTEVAAGTGLVHASVTALVADLVARGLVEEVGAAVTGARGRPRRLLRLVPERVRTTAVHVTWEHITVMTAGLAGSPGGARQLAHHQGPFGPREGMADAIAAAVTESVPAAPGVHHGRLVIAMAGPVTDARADDPGRGWHAPELAALVADRLSGQSCPVDVVNDANMAALAEQHALAAAGDDPGGTVAYVKSDAGVAGALIINGRIHHGSYGLAGELGHIPVTLDGPACRCGATGCLTTYISTRAVLDAAGLGDLAAPHDSGAALAELGRRLQSAEPRALAALDRAGRALGAAIQSIIGMVDAERIVLGGHLAEWLPWLLPGIKVRMDPRRAAFPTLPVAVSPGVFGPDAALHGAIAAGRARILADPTAVPGGRGSGGASCAGSAGI
ncbi:ROK family transcriptional regulator [Streptomyces mayonensis]|uniref:ROK family transcriptional regulator n=1 Tax=Streptomyces mayonensis TaxID=2750816 RepID=UPI001C1E6A74|nr:ROK family transcriptional regulator [Streptomyces sp. A108]MBU6529628.1 ROK family transcriptional regulator [Streptomyces sp. A108]